MEQQLMFGCLFKKIHIAFESHCNKYLQKYNLTHSQLSVILYLNKNKDLLITQRDLEAELRLKNPTVTGILKRLEEKNLIYRQINENDKRSKFIKLTEKGQSLIEEGSKNMENLELNMFEGFSNKEKEELTILLTKILNNFN